MTQPAFSAPVFGTSHVRAAVTGRVIEPRDADYDDARQVFNAGIDRRPAVIVQPADAAEVAAVVALAREHGVELAVRGGGHGMAGHGTTDTGIVLDLSAMRDLLIDVESRTAWAQAGVTAGQYTLAAAEHGLATGFGDTPSVGISGLTLGGGIGWLVRKHGMTIDDLLAVELVTADGRLLHADAQTHTELFWALRGGGGNFGVVTRLQYRLHEVDTVLGGMLILPASPTALRSFVTIADEAPDEMSTIVHVGAAPPLPMIPAEHHGKRVMMILVVHAGDVEEGERLVARIRALAPALVDDVKPMPYTGMYEDDGPPRAPMTVRSTFLDELDEHATATIFEQLDAAPTPIAVAQIRVLGGAMGRIAPDATAFAHRARRMLVTIAAASPGPGDPAERETWADGFLAALRPAASGAFISFMVDEGQDRVREAFPPRTYERLLSVKRQYDPTNLFRLNQNVTPDG